VQAGARAGPPGSATWRKAGGESRPLEVADFPRKGKRLVVVAGEASVYPVKGEKLWVGERDAALLPSRVSRGRLTRNPSLLQ
jgi:hypothetical protein